MSCPIILRETLVVQSSNCLSCFIFFVLFFWGREGGGRTVCVGSSVGALVDRPVFAPPRVGNPAGSIYVTLTLISPLRSSSIYPTTIITVTPSKTCSSTPRHRRPRPLTWGYKVGKKNGGGGGRGAEWSFSWTVWRVPKIAFCAACYLLPVKKAGRCCAWGVKIGVIVLSLIWRISARPDIFSLCSGPDRSGKPVRIYTYVFL